MSDLEYDIYMAFVRYMPTRLPQDVIAAIRAAGYSIVPTTRLAALADELAACLGEDSDLCRDGEAT